MTTRPEPDRLDTVRGATRQIIGFTRSIAFKAVGNPDLTPKEGQEALEAVSLLMTTYISLLEISHPSNRSYMAALTGLSDSEQEDYKYVRHAKRILGGMYGPKDASAS